MAQEPDKETAGKLRDVGLGLDAEAFKRSPLGRWLLDRAAKEAIAAMSKLKKVNAAQVDEVRDLQAKIYQMETFEDWIDEAITMGNNAQEQLLHQEAVQEDET